MQSKISELEERQIINIADGKCLGSMKDIEVDLEEGRIRAIVLPGSTGLWGLLFIRSSQPVFTLGQHQQNISTS